MSTAASDEYIAVGVPSSDNGTTVGRVDIFNASTGAFIKSILPPNTYANNNFGWSIAISGNTLVVGSPFEPRAATPSGRVYMFDIVSGNLTRTLDSPDASGTADGDNYGTSVAIDGNVMLVGATTEKLTQFSANSKVYVYNLLAAP